MVPIMVPIPKGVNKDLTNMKNYRGIALSSLISYLIIVSFFPTLIFLNQMLYNLHIKKTLLLYNVYQQ